MFDENNQEIMAGSHTLMEQAPMTIDTYLRGALKTINNYDGVASRICDDPQAAAILLGSLVEAMAVDFATSMLGAKLQEIRDALRASAE